MKSTASITLITSALLLSSVVSAQSGGGINSRATHIIKLRSAMNTSTGTLSAAYIINL